MRIQKLTVLDAARLARELERFRNATIRAVLGNESRTEAYIALENPTLMLKYHVDSKTAYLSVIDSFPASSLNIIPGLNGHVLTGASQMNLDRIIKIALEKGDRLGRKIPARLIFELIPNTGNMLFTDDAGSIKGSLKRSKVRKYIAPSPLKKPTILNSRDGRIAEMELERETILERIYGLNARDVINLSEEILNRPDAATDLLEGYANRAVRPGPAWMIMADSRPVGYSLVEPSLAPGESKVEFDSALLLYEAYYGQAVEWEGEESRLKQMLALLDKEIYRRSRKIEDLEKAATQNKESLNFKKYGELILANIGEIKKGSRSIRLADIETSPQEIIEIKLDPARSPAANAEAYFKKYRKAIASEDVLGERLKAALERLELLRSARDEYGHDGDLLEAELKELGIIGSARGAHSRIKQERRRPYRKFQASCGWEILVGRANADNDELTFKIAAKHDFWFHAWQAAGSHTILRLPARNSMPDRQTLHEAASLAAYFSKARRSSKVPVIYTQVRYIRKPKKFPPGKVLVEREKQLMVKPADPDDFLPVHDQ